MRREDENTKYDDDKLIEAYLDLADEDTPDLWSRIEEGLDRKSVHRRRRSATVFAGAAAAVIVCALVLTGLINSGVLNIRDSRQTDNSASYSETNEMAADDYDETESVDESDEEEQKSYALEEEATAAASDDERTADATEEKSKAADDDTWSDDSVAADSDTAGGSAQTDSDMENSAHTDNLQSGDAQTDNVQTDNTQVDNAQTDSETAEIRVTLASWEIMSAGGGRTVYSCMVKSAGENDFGIEADTCVEVICEDEAAAESAVQSGAELDGYLTEYDNESGVWTFAVSDNDE